MKQEKCSVCNEFWMVSICRNIYFLPTDPLQYFTKTAPTDSIGCPACDLEENWNYTSYQSL